MAIIEYDGWPIDYQSRNHILPKEISSHRRPPLSGTRAISPHRKNSDYASGHQTNANAPGARRAKSTAE
jgi:hypothetical protein